MNLEELKRKVKVLEDIEAIKNMHRDYIFWLRNSQFDEMIVKIEELLKMPDLKTVWQRRRLKMLENTEDVNHFIINLLEK